MKKGFINIMRGPDTGLFSVHKILREHEKKTAGARNPQRQHDCRVDAGEVIDLKVAG